MVFSLFPEPLGITVNWNIAIPFYNYYYRATPSDPPSHIPELNPIQTVSQILDSNRSLITNLTLPRQPQQPRIR